MSIEKEILEEYKKQINEHFEENRKGAQKAKSALEKSRLFAGGNVDKTVHIPKVFSEETMEHFREIADMATGIFGKVMDEYRKHEDYRKLFPFSKELEKLILLPKQYDAVLPIARYDLFYNEETGNFKFCEINTDGTAAMLRDLEMRRALKFNPAHQEVIKKYDLEPFELFDTWISEFMDVYKTYPKKKENPNVAIVDILENATMGDFEEFKERFEKAGINCEICDIRSLKYKDDALYSPSGMRINAIYRRAVTADIMAYYDEVTDFLEAVRDDKVFFAGAFETQIIHSKWIFYVLHLDRTKCFLTDKERAFVEKHVPLTLEFSNEYIPLEEVQTHKDKYMIKPMDAYASKGVYAAGREYDADKWKELAEKLYGKGYICQEYCDQYLTDNIDFAWGDGKWHKYINMPGLYMYNGKISGFLMRMAEGENIIYAHENERTVPVFKCKG